MLLNTRFPFVLTVTHAVEFPFEEKFVLRLSGDVSVFDVDWRSVPLYGKTILGSVSFRTPICVTAKNEFANKLAEVLWVETFTQ
jgi:hypothetical protein